MTSSEFVIWFKGFTEACNDFTATPKQWDRIKEVLNEVEDYNDNPGLDEEIDNYHPNFPNGTIHVTGVANAFSGSLNGTSGNSTMWNDQMGCWHYTNYPEGFGYYTNSTANIKKEKQQLND